MTAGQGHEAMPKDPNLFAREAVGSSTGQRPLGTPPAATAEPPVLETERLVMRPPSQTDPESANRIFDEPSVRRHLFDDEPVSPETTRSLLEKSERDFADGGVGLFGIRRRGSRELVGFCGFLSSRRSGSQS